MADDKKQQKSKHPRKSPLGLSPKDLASSIPMLFWKLGVALGCKRAKVEYGRAFVKPETQMKIKLNDFRQRFKQLQSTTDLQEQCLQEHRYKLFLHLYRLLLRLEPSETKRQQYLAFCYHLFDEENPQKMQLEGKLRYQEDFTENLICLAQSVLHLNEKELEISSSKGRTGVVLEMGFLYVMCKPVIVRCQFKGLRWERAICKANYVGMNRSAINEQKLIRDKELKIIYMAHPKSPEQPFPMSSDVMLCEDIESQMRPYAHSRQPKTAEKNRNPLSFLRETCEVGTQFMATVSAVELYKNSKSVCETSDVSSQFAEPLETVELYANSQSIKETSELGIDLCVYLHSDKSQQTDTSTTQLDQGVQTYRTEPSADISTTTDDLLTGLSKDTTSTDKAASTTASEGKINGLIKQQGSTETDDLSTLLDSTLYPSSLNEMRLNFILTTSEELLPDIVYTSIQEEQATNDSLIVLHKSLNSISTLPPDNLASTSEEFKDWIYTASEEMLPKINQPIIQQELAPSMTIIQSGFITSEPTYSGESPTREAIEVATQDTNTPPIDTSDSQHKQEVLSEGPKQEQLSLHEIPPPPNFKSGFYLKQISKESSWQYKQLPNIEQSIVFPEIDQSFVNDKCSSKEICIDKSPELDTSMSAKLLDDNQSIADQETTCATDYSKEASGELQQESHSASDQESSSMDSSKVVIGELQSEDQAMILTPKQSLFVIESEDVCEETDPSVLGNGNDLRAENESNSEQKLAPLTDTLGMLVLTTEMLAKIHSQLAQLKMVPNPSIKKDSLKNIDCDQWKHQQETEKSIETPPESIPESSLLDETIKNADSRTQLQQLMDHFPQIAEIPTESPSVATEDSSAAPMMCQLKTKEESETSLLEIDLSINHQDCLPDSPKISQLDDFKDSEEEMFLQLERGSKTSLPTDQLESVRTEARSISSENFLSPLVYERKFTHDVEPVRRDQHYLVPHRLISEATSVFAEHSLSKTSRWLMQVEAEAEYKDPVPEVKKPDYPSLDWSQESEPLTDTHSVIITKIRNFIKMLQPTNQAQLAANRTIKDQARVDNQLEIKEEAVNLSIEIEQSLSQQKLKLDNQSISKHDMIMCKVSANAINQDADRLRGMDINEGVSPFDQSITPTAIALPAKWQHQRHVIAASPFIIKQFKCNPSYQCSPLQPDGPNFYEQWKQFVEIVATQTSCPGPIIDVAAIKRRLKAYLRCMRKQYAYQPDECLEAIGKCQLQQLLTSDELQQYETLRWQQRDRGMVVRLSPEERLGDALHALLGYECQQMRVSALSRRLMLRSPHHQSSISESYVLLALAEVGYYYKCLQQQQEVLLQRLGEYGRALAPCLMAELQAYSRFYQRHKEQLTSLTQVYHQSRSYVHRFQWLLQLCGELSHQPSPLQYLQLQLGLGNAGYDELLKQWMECAAEPLLKRIRGWLQQGELLEGDFFIVEHAAGSQIQNYWLQQFELRPERLPHFLNPHLARQLLATGRNQHFSRHFLARQLELVVQELELEQQLASACHSSFRELDEQPLVELIGTLQLDTSRQLFEQLHQLRPNPLELLSRLHQYLLLTDVEFVREMIELLEPLLEQPAECYCATQLNNRLEQLLVAHNKPLYVARGEQQGSRCWCCFLLRWQQPSHWKTLLGERLVQYESCFVCLWQLHYSDYVLNERIRRQQAHFSERVNLERFPEARQVRDQFDQLIDRLQDFMLQLRSYMLENILDSAFEELYLGCNTVKTLDELLQLQGSYMEKILKGLWLTRDNARLRLLLMQLYEPIFQLDVLQQKFLSLCQRFSADEMAQRQQELRRCCQTTCDAIHDLEQDFQLALANLLLALYKTNEPQACALAKKLDHSGFYEQRYKELKIVHTFRYQRKIQIQKNSHLANL
ncbi:PREDICTED: uncharacterized protein LOC108609491 [Drosophila arizonae]|uniref:Uncharacterized protein LOC108609491 n=1 Tax=Drosophila arizonae TaxID=7263 RepID=A0ABM1NP14_DROAR|nr:PREDICTED: uncharacterized protein LOC108609491 [Drosophila arizonae]